MPELTVARSVPAFVMARGLKPLPPAARYVLRGGEPVRKAAATAAGVSLPVEPCRANAQGERAALWLGPDEWLLIAPENDAAALARSLAKALGGLPHALVDVSHRQSGCELRGPHAVTLLAAGCPLDMDERAFPVGMCTRTVLEKAEVVLWRTGIESFRLDVARSFVAYVSEFLADAARSSLMD